MDPGRFRPGQPWSAGRFNALAEKADLLRRLVAGRGIVVRSSGAGRVLDLDVPSEAIWAKIAPDKSTWTEQVRVGGAWVNGPRSGDNLIVLGDADFGGKVVAGWLNLKPPTSSETNQFIGRYNRFGVTATCQVVRVTVKCPNTSGTTVAGVPVSLDLSGTPAGSGTTNGSGYVDIPVSLGAGTYTATAGGPGSGFTTGTANVIVGATCTTYNATVAVCVNPTVNITVQNAAGCPIPGAAVVVSGPVINTSGSTDGSGVFEFLFDAETCTSSSHTIDVTPPPGWGWGGGSKSAFLFNNFDCGVPATINITFSLPPLSGYEYLPGSGLYAIASDVSYSDDRGSGVGSYGNAPDWTGSFLNGWSGSFSYSEADSADSALCSGTPTCDYPHTTTVLVEFFVSLTGDCSGGLTGGAVTRIGGVLAAHNCAFDGPEFGKWAVAKNFGSGAPCGSGFLVTSQGSGATSRSGTAFSISGPLTYEGGWSGGSNFGDHPISGQLGGGFTVTGT